MSAKVWVTLSNGEDDELRLGPFNQGVVLESNEIVDVATSRRIARQSPYWDSKDWKADEEVENRYSNSYSRVFIQLVDPAEQARENFFGSSA